MKFTEVMFVLGDVAGSSLGHTVTGPNQAPLPTPMSVTYRADARSAPATGAAEL